MKRIFLIELSSKTYTKRPESKHNNDKVDCVSEEHQHIDVCDCTVLWMDQVMEELLHRKVDLHEPTEEKKGQYYCEQKIRRSSALNWIKELLCSECCFFCLELPAEDLKFHNLILHSIYT